MVRRSGKKQLAVLSKKEHVTYASLLLAIGKGSFRGVNVVAHGVPLVAVHQGGEASRIRGAPLLMGA